ncbi:MAG: hypothetical protein R3Y67_04400 [Eubacteriales bacterium]
MKNKTRILTLSIVLAMALTGCSSTVQLTEDESKIIAQYAANLIVDYHSDTKSRMLTEMETDEEEVEEGVDEEKVDAEEAEEETVENQEEIETQEEVEEEVVPTTSDINEVLPVAGTYITYLNYGVVKQYTDNDGMGISAKDNHMLVILNYQVGNVTDSDTTIDFFADKVSATLSIDGGDAVSNMFTILPGDMAMLQETIAPGESVEAFLMFEVPVEMIASVTSLELTLTGSGGVAQVTLQ